MSYEISIGGHMVRIAALSLAFLVGCGHEAELHTARLDTGDPWSFFECACGDDEWPVCASPRWRAEKIAETWAGDFKCECYRLLEECPEDYLSQLGTL